MGKFTPKIGPHGDFCDKCFNVMVIQECEENPMKNQKVCRNCKYKKEIHRAECVYHVDLQKGTTDIPDNLPIERIPQANTIATIETKQCPNNECQEKNAPIKMVVLNDTQKKYLYICSNCKHYWKNTIQ